MTIDIAEEHVDYKLLPHHQDANKHNEFDYSELSYLHNLEYLDIFGPIKDLNFLSELSNLKELYLRFNGRGLTNKSFSNLKVLNNFYKLHLDTSAEILYEFSQNAEKFPNIKKLKLNHMNLLTVSHKF